MKMFWIGAACATSVCFASGARAATFVETWQGDFWNSASATSIDSLGLFGTRGSTLIGSFMATVTYDTSVGNYYTSPTNNVLDGGGVYSAPQNANAVFTANGHSFTIQGTWWSEIRSSPTQEFAGVEDAAYTPSHDNAFSIWADNGVNSLTSSVDLGISPSANTYQGIFQFSEAGVGQEMLYLSPTHFSRLGATSAAPEPGAWAMMILGFFGLGAVLRGRRKPICPTTA